MEQTSRQIGPYDLRDELGRSSFYTTYLAYDSDAERFAAVKVAGARISGSSALTEQFIVAGERAARLRHRGIVPVYSSGMADGVPYIAMQYVDGLTLRRWLDGFNGLISSAEAAGIARQIASALDYAHRLGVVHRELHADNVFVADDGRILVADFTLAEVKAAAGSNLPANYVHTADLPYLAPEQLQAPTTVNSYADIYSLGVITYNMLTGSLPFRGDDSDTLRRAIVHEMPMPPEYANPNVPPGMAYVLKCVLAKEPGMRYATAADFATALHEGQMWIPGVSSAEEAAATGTPRSGAGGTWIARNRVALFLLLALAAIVVAALALLQTSPQLNARVAQLAGFATPAISIANVIDRAEDAAGVMANTATPVAAGDSGNVDAVSGDATESDGGVAIALADSPTPTPDTSPDGQSAPEPTNGNQPTGTATTVLPTMTSTAASTVGSPATPTAMPSANASPSPIATAPAEVNAGAVTLEPASQTPSPDSAPRGKR